MPPSTARTSSAVPIRCISLAASAQATRWRWALCPLLLYRLISRSFLKIATSSGKTERKVYRETRTERQSASAALLRKEFSRFTASPNYMLNCGLGTLMLPIAGVVLLVYQAKIRDLELLLGAEFASLLFIAAVCLLASMNDMAAPSVSRMV